MLTVIIQPSTVKGGVRIPPSKSVTQRALALALTHDGTSILHGAGHSKDEQQVAGIIEALGASIRRVDDQTIEIRGVDKIKPEVCLDCGESALAARMFTCIAALASEKILIKGKGSLMKRPMDGLIKMLEPRVKYLHSDNGKLPIEICGPLKISEEVIDGASSSQHLTGLLIALAISVSVETQIEVRELVGKPYVDLTLSLLDSFGCRVEHEDYRRFTIYPRSVLKAPVRLQIEADWSNAAFWVVAGAMGEPLLLKGLSLESKQGDKVILDVARAAGVSIVSGAEGLIVSKSGVLKPFEFDASNYPDLFPPLSVLAAFIEGVSVIKGVTRLHTKESDRALSILEMLKQLGVSAEVKSDDMLIYGGRLRGGSVDSFGDHRIAMAASIAALGAEGAVTVGRAEAVEKSYPTFFSHLAELGVSLSLNIQNQDQ
jgi:3-phosphoshikimate 1-carboxyvinyltransferase